MVRALSSLQRPKSGEAHQGPNRVGSFQSKLATSHLMGFEYISYVPGFDQHCEVCEVLANVPSEKYKLPKSSELDLKAIRTFLHQPFTFFHPLLSVQLV